MNLSLLKLAWRNLWRNKRRTYITLSSITFALFFSILMSSFTLGMIQSMLQHNLEAYSGYLQIQNKEFVDDPSLDTSFEVKDSLYQCIQSNSNILSIVPRLETFSLASVGTHSKGCIVSGIDLEEEKKMSNPKQFLVDYYLSENVLKELKNRGYSDLTVQLEPYKGATYKSFDEMQLALGLTSKEIERVSELSRFENTYLAKQDQGVLLSSGLARYLKAMPGDSIILLGQGYQGMSAAVIAPVRGWIQMASPELNNKLIYMTQSFAQNYLSIENRVTAWVINLKHPEKMLETQKDIASVLPNDLIVRNWEEISPSLKQQTQENIAEVQIFTFILYLILFFGILGTMQMMLSERREEFNVLVSIGMKRGYIAYVFALEVLILGMVSLVVGLLISGVIISVMQYFPITFTGEFGRAMQNLGYNPSFVVAGLDLYFWIQIPVVFLMVLLAIIQPIRQLMKWDIRSFNR